MSTAGAFGGQLKAINNNSEKTEQAQESPAALCSKTLSERDQAGEDQSGDKYCDRSNRNNAFVMHSNII